tara:strand:+ start:852 stop:1577 length:726 start_codon:yes stop_codon:yes gene_type:complete
MESRSQAEDDNVELIGFLFMAAYIVGAVAFMVYVSNEGMWDKGSGYHTDVVLGQLFLFLAVGFITGLVGSSYIPEKEKSPHAIENDLYWFIEVLGNAFDFEGKSSRPMFWIYMLWSSLISIGLDVISHATLYGKFYDNSFLNFSIIFTLITLIPGLAIGARRLHDTGRSGWLQLLILTIIGIIPLIIWFAQKSNESSKEKTGNSLNPENLTTELEKLSNMHKDGKISDSEYAKAKARLLND